MIFKVLVLVTAAVLLAAGAGCGISFSPGCAAARLPGPGPTAAPGDALTVAEQGFTALDATTFSLGAVLVNHSRMAAYHTHVELRLTDAGGRLAWAQPAATEIPVILPGRRAAVGTGAAIVDDPHPDVGRMTVTVRDTRWLAADADNRLFTTHPDRLGVASEQPVPPEAELVMDPPPINCGGLTSHGAALVFRDANGTPVGGDTAPTSDVPCNGGGEFAERLRARYAPPTADLIRTDLTLYCDAAPVNARGSPSPPD